MDVLKVVSGKIKEVKKDRKDAVYGASMSGAMNPEYEANVSKYDYTLKKLGELFEELVLKG